MAKKSTKGRKPLVVAEDKSHRLVCTADGFEYIPDTMRYI
jgi:hypothetical protein